MEKKPQDITGYKEWLKREHRIALTDKHENHYESVANKLKRDVEDSTFWAQLLPDLRDEHAEFQLKNGYPLLATPDSAPSLVLKPYGSFLLKTFRRNVLENAEWPEEPEGGWLLPPGWYERIDDIVRTLIVSKYLGGVLSLATWLQERCTEPGMTCRADLEAKPEGYYAAHVYATRSFEIPGPTFDTVHIQTSIEIQVCTELQEHIQRLLHQYYEKRRARAGPEKMKWQWNYESTEFAAQYLGHILHYVEGMIMEIMRREREKR